MNEVMVKSNNGWYDRIIGFIKEVKEPAEENDLKSIFNKYRITPVGTSANPGYICVIRQGNFVRFGFSRRPKQKIKQTGRDAEKQELVWYGYTDNMLLAKQSALQHFADYRSRGAWLRISPIMAITYFKRRSE